MTSVVARYVAASTAIADDEEQGRDEPPVEAEHEDDHRDDREDRARLREMRSHRGHIGAEWRAVLGQPVDDLVVPVQDRSGEHDLDEQDPGRDRGHDERHVADGQRDRTGDRRMQGREPVGEAFGDAVGRSPEQRRFATAAFARLPWSRRMTMLAGVTSGRTGLLPPPGGR